MNRDTFEKMATQYGLDLNRNEQNYLNYTTQMAWEFFLAGFDQCQGMRTDETYPD